MEKYILTQWKNIFEYRIFPRYVNCILIDGSAKEIEEIFTLNSASEHQILPT